MSNLECTVHCTLYSTSELSLTGHYSAQVGSAYKSRTGRVVGHIAMYGHDLQRSSTMFPWLFVSVVFCLATILCSPHVFCEGIVKPQLGSVLLYEEEAE